MDRFCDLLYEERYQLFQNETKEKPMIHGTPTKKYKVWEQNKILIENTFHAF